MPVRSKAQYRLMKAVESGSAKVPGLSKEEAKDFTKGMTSKRWSKLKEKIKRG